MATRGHTRAGEHYPDPPPQDQIINENESPRHERTDLRLRPIIFMFVVLTVAAIVGHAVLWGLFRLASNWQVSNNPEPAPLMQREQVPPEPRLQVSPRQDEENMLLDHLEQVNSYGWVDQGNGVARIPIDRAMDLVLERGLPAREDGGPGRSVDAQEADDLESEGGQPPVGDTFPQPGVEGTAAPDVQSTAAPATEAGATATATGTQ